jgi:hypothetical protein
VPPHVLDAAIWTANALHQQTPFDFAISLGDTCNNTSYHAELFKQPSQQMIAVLKA